VSPEIETSLKEKMKTIVIINEQHSLLPEQEKIISFFIQMETMKVPASGWTIEEQKKIVNDWNPNDIAIFVSPVPVLLALLANKLPTVGVFANDKREKKELPNGKIISVTAKTGWKLIFTE